MKMILKLIVCVLFVNDGLSILDANFRTKRHIWRGNPTSQVVEEPRYIQTKGGRHHHHPAPLHQPSYTLECAPHENGIKSHPYSCQMYINCVDGEVIVDTCSEGFLFNDATKECDFASLVTCRFANEQTARLTSFQPNSYRDTSHYTDTDREVISHFQCPHEGLFEHPHDCSKFIQCAHSGLFVQSCGPGTLFNPALLVCDWPKNVQCNKNLNSNIRSETPSPTSQFSHNQRGHETRPIDADYDYNIDVRMSETNSRNNNNNQQQQHRVYTTSSVQNENTQGNYQRRNDTLRSYPFQATSHTDVQYPPRTSPQYNTPSRTLQPPAQTIAQPVPYDSSTQQREHPATASQGRSFQSEPNRQNGILTSVVPLVNHRSEQNGNLVHSSPSYAKTKVYSSQQSYGQNRDGQSYPHEGHEPQTYPQQSFHQPQSYPQQSFHQQQRNYPEQSHGTQPSYHGHGYPQQSHQQHSNIYPTLPPNQYSPPHEGNADSYPVNRLSPSNRQLENFDQTMDLLDAYANFETRSRNEAQNDRANVMTVERNQSDRDHEIPIYNRPARPERPANVQFTSRTSDDLQSEATAHALNDALKLMLSPYAKSAPMKNEEVDVMTTRILNTAAAVTDTTGTDGTVQEGGIDDAIAKEEPVPNFVTINPQRNLFTPTPTPDTETLPDFNSPAHTKTSRFPPRTNSLVNNDQHKQYGQGSQLAYHGEVVELFCTTGFDCGNGVCLSSAKICDGRDDCGNRLDESHCKNISYDVRLVGNGDRQNVGLIEVKVFDKWGRICGDRIGMNEANVFCREAGYPLGAVEVKMNNDYQSQVSVGDHPNYVLDELHCNGNETSLKDCEFNGWDVRDCGVEETVGVVCKLPDMKCQLNYWLCDQSEECIPTAFLCDSVKDCSDGSDESAYHCNSSIQYRLGNQKLNQKEGRVEVRYKGIWGTVCDDDFGENEAKVFCRSLGYDGAAAVIKEFAVPGDGLIWLDQVSCLGNETSLEQCTHFDWGENNCNHTEDVSVRCFEQVGTSQKLTQRDPRTDYHHLNEIHHSSRTDEDHCGQIRVPDYPDPDYNDQPVFKVIEGREAKRGHHPWQATLRVRGRNGKSSHWCGAVLISKTHVLTAAHCLIGFTKSAYFIRLGDHHSETPEDTEVEVFIEDWHIHERFRKGHLMNNDIALIKLKSAVKFTDYIQPICLPTEDTQYTVGKNCSISGWGSIQYGRSTPSLQLRSAHLPIMSDDICKQPHNYGNSIQNGMFCAGIPDNMIDACDGDSGGPFVCQDDEENGYHSLYGIISWGQRCGDRHKPGVYTKVSEYLSWINEKMML